jgi:Uma2 family endonuclease
MNYADYKQWNDNVRRELIDGVVYNMASPSDYHQAISMALSAIFYNFLRGKKCQVRAAPYDVRLFASKDEEDDTVVQPDLVVVCDEEKRTEHGYCGAPSLVIEILSPSTRYRDMMQKFVKYAQAGVPEYWIIDPLEKTVSVYKLAKTPEGNFYQQPVVYKQDGKVPVGIFNGELTVQLDEVFA